MTLVLPRMLEQRATRYLSEPIKTTSSIASVVLSIPLYSYAFLHFAWEYTFIPTSLASPSLRRFYNTKDAIEHLRGNVKKRERDSFEIRPSDTEYKNELVYRI